MQDSERLVQVCHFPEIGAMVLTNKTAPSQKVKRDENLSR